MSKVDNNQYILGTNIDELERLGLQHRLWADVSARSWRKAGIKPGSKVLDLGCGPGYASVDMAQLVGTEGQIIGVDQSHSFLESVKQKAKVLNLPQLTALSADAEQLQNTFSNSENFDVAYTRWLLCWLKNPEKTIQGVFNLLKPGGKLIIHDYFNWGTMTLAPRCKTIEKMVIAAVESFDERGGDIDIAGRVPSILAECGFELRHFDVHQRAAIGGGEDGTLYWMLTWWRSYAPKLVEMGKLTKEELNIILNKLTSLENDKNQFFTTPPVFEFIAVKPI